jgi:hypothetical protein
MLQACLVPRMDRDGDKCGHSSLDILNIYIYMWFQKINGFTIKQYILPNPGNLHQPRINQCLFSNIATKMLF